MVQDRGVFEPSTGSSVSKAQYTGGVHLTAVVVAKTLKSRCSRKVRAPNASELDAYTQRAKCWQFSGGPLPLFHYIWHFPDRKNTIYGGLISAGQVNTFTGYPNPRLQILIAYDFTKCVTHKNISSHTS